MLPFSIEIPAFNTNSLDPDQMPRLRRLIWVYTVCQCPFDGTLGKNGLRHDLNKSILTHIGMQTSVTAHGPS